MARFSPLNSLESLVEMTEGGTLSGAAFSGSSFKLLSSFTSFLKMLVALLQPWSMR